MEGSGTTYLDFAENDYQFFRSVYDEGIIGGPLASMGHNICEKFLKHVISEYAEAETDSEQQRKERVLHTHNLQLLMRYIQNDMGLEIPEETEINLERINGFYFSTRYPGDDSFIATGRDVEKANAAVESARDFVNNICYELEHGNDIQEEIESEEPETTNPENHETSITAEIERRIAQARANANHSVDIHNTEISDDFER